MMFASKVLKYSRLSPYPLVASACTLVAKWREVSRWVNPERVTKEDTNIIGLDKEEINLILTWGPFQGEGMYSPLLQGKH